MPRGELSASDIMTAILSTKASLGDCAREAHGEPGKVLLVFDILPTGEVANIGVSDAEVASLAVSMCIAKVISGLRFPSSSKGETIVFPFKF